MSWAVTNTSMRGMIVFLHRLSLLGSRAGQRARENHEEACGPGLPRSQSPTPQLHWIRNHCHRFSGNSIRVHLGTRAHLSFGVMFSLTFARRFKLEVWRFCRPSGLVYKMTKEVSYGCPG